MTDYGLVSIITPSWNCGKFVEETIQSVLAQTYANWELLFQDDCSTDNTKEIVLAYAEKDKRIKYACNAQNSGAAITRNNALKRAKGKWIAFLDSDDLWLPNKLEEQLQFMVDNNYAFSYTNYSEINEQSHELGKIITGPKHITKSGMYAYCWPGCLTVMYNQEIVGNIQINLQFIVLIFDITYGCYSIAIICLNMFIKEFKISCIKSKPRHSRPNSWTARA